MTALEQFNTIMESETIDEPIERLRFFISLALTGQDWLDIEQFIDGVSQQLASRDAEIARLKTVPMRYRRMAFNAQLQDEVARLEQENDQLRAHINMLRDAFQTFIYEHEECQDADEWMAELCSIEAMHFACEALDTIPEQSLFEYRNNVIEAFVNEFSRHVGGDGEFWLHELQDFAMKEQP